MTALTVTSSISPAVASGAQAPQKQISTKAAQTSKKDASAGPQTEMERRLSALKAAFQSGDPQAIGRADRKLLAFGLKQMAELRMVEGSFPQAIEIYQQSIDFEDLPYSHLRLALALLEAKRPADAMGETEKTLFSDPQNALAWRLQGSAWMRLKQYKKGEDALAHSLKLKGDADTAYNLALCFLADHQKDKAQLVFDDLMKNLGDTGDVHVKIARAYRDENYPKDAEREFRRAIAVDPKTPRAHYFLGLLLLMNNEWFPTPEVKDLLAAELKLDPKDPPTNYLVGMFASGDKLYDESDRYLSIAAQGFPDWPEMPLFMGLNAYGRGDDDRAEVLLQKAITLTGSDESRSSYQIRRAYIALGRILLLKGQKTESEKYFEKSRQLLQAALAQSQQSVADTIAAQGGSVGMGAIVPLVEKAQEDQVESEVYFGDAADRLDPAAFAKLPPEQKQQAEDEEKYLREILGSSFNDLGTSDAREQKFTEALYHFQQAERWNPTIPGLIRNLGIAAFKVGNYQEASRALSQQLTANPQDAPIAAMLGLCYFSLNRFSDAAKILSPLGLQSRSDPGIAYPLAASLARTGDIKQASDVLNGMEQQELPADTLLLVGQTWSEIGDYGHALQTLRRALQLDPSLLKAHYSAGLALINSDRPGEAQTEFQAELLLNPEDYEAKYHLAYTFLLQSQPEKAEPLLREVIAEAPEHSDAHYQLGKILLEQGKVDEALPYLERAERLSPEKDYVHYQLQAAYRKNSRLQDADRELQLYKETKARNRERSAPVIKSNK